MKMTITLLTLVLANSAMAAKETPNENKPRIEVCFVLDTTGSMSDLLEGAKQKIWSIANDMISAKPTPESSGPLLPASWGRYEPVQLRHADPVERDERDEDDEGAAPTASASG